MKKKGNSKLSTQQKSTHSLRHSRTDLLCDKRSSTIYIRRPGQLSYIWRGRYQVLSDTSCSDIFVFASAFGFGPACINVI